MPKPELCHTVSTIPRLRDFLSSLSNAPLSDGNWVNDVSSDGGTGGFSVPTSSSGGSSIGTTIVGGGSGVPTGAGGYRLEKEGRLEGNCGAPLFTSVEGLYVPLTPPLDLGCKFKGTFKWSNDHPNKPPFNVFVFQTQIRKLSAILIEYNMDRNHDKLNGSRILTGKCFKNLMNHWIQSLRNKKTVV